MLIAATALALGSFVMFAVGMLVFGFGAAGDRLSRYAAADISTPERRSFSIAIVVWAGTIGAVVGPVLLDPVKNAAESLGLEGLAGPPLLAAVTFGLAAILIMFGLRPDPLSFVEEAAGPPRSQWAMIRPLLRTQKIRYAVTALIIGQVVMVLIMTMTPIHIRRGGDGLGIVGLVIGAHTFGMFAISPLTGLFADRVGRLPVMITGQIVLVVSALVAATTGTNDRSLLIVALFLLGLGWNLGFVAGSAYLIEGVEARARVPLQGFTDTIVWSSGAVASLSSGFLTRGHRLFGTEPGGCRPGHRAGGPRPAIPPGVVGSARRRQLIPGPPTPVRFPHCWTTEGWFRHTSAL